MKTIEKRIDQSVNSLSKISKIKSDLVNRLSAEYSGVGRRLVYQAVNEADAVASLTIVPLLVLPALAEEKVQKVAQWSAHQHSVLRPDSVAFAA